MSHANSAASARAAAAGLSLAEMGHIDAANDAAKPPIDDSSAAPPTTAPPAVSVANADAAPPAVPVPAPATSQMPSSGAPVADAATVAAANASVSSGGDEAAFAFPARDPNLRLEALVAMAKGANEENSCVSLR